MTFCAFNTVFLTGLMELVFAHSRQARSNSLLYQQIDVITNSNCSGSFPLLFKEGLGEVANKCSLFTLIFVFF